MKELTKEYFNTKNWLEARNGLNCGAFTEERRDQVVKSFWEFVLDTKYFIKFCLNHDVILKQDISGYYLGVDGKLYRNSYACLHVIRSLILTWLSINYKEVEHI